MTTKPYEECSWLQKAKRRIVLAFSAPSLPGPIKIRGRTARELSKEFGRSSVKEVEVEVNGKIYYVMRSTPPLYRPFHR